MSNVLIKDMEMPENCHECPFEILNKCFATSREDCRVESLDRPEWCPLEPAPLATDLETLQTRYDKQFAAGQRDAYDTIRKMVDLFEGLIKIGRKEP